MTDVRTHTRRPPQPPIDPALVVPGSRWQKNRADYRDKPPVFDVVDRIEELTGASGTTDIEGSLVLGAHGPRFLHVVIVGEQPGAQTTAP